MKGLVEPQIRRVLKLFQCFGVGFKMQSHFSLRVMTKTSMFDETIAIETRLKSETRNYPLVL
jgi:hypothetical protein